PARLSKRFATFAIRLIWSSGRSRPGRGRNGQKFIRLERGAADQAAIDVGHGKQLRRIPGLDAAAVEDPCGGRDSTIPGRDPFTDEGMDVLRLLGRGVSARADRP